MNEHCTFCGKDNTLEPLKLFDVRSYHGTKSYGDGTKELYHPECHAISWTDTTWHLDCIDERMNANVYFKRKDGLKGDYDDGEITVENVDASWNKLDFEYMTGKPYKFKNRRPHPKTMDGSACPCGYA